MAFTRRALAGLAIITTVVLGTSLAVAGTAAAQDPGVWRAYGNTNPITSSSSTWRCAPTEQIAYKVAAQVCAIRARDGEGVQAAIIVRNNRAGLFIARDTYVTLGQIYHDLGYWECPESGVGENSWSVCFGRTLKYLGDVHGRGSAQLVYLGESPTV